MSSSEKKDTEDVLPEPAVAVPSSSHDENLPNAAAAATAATVLGTIGPLVPYKPAPHDKANAIPERKGRHHHRRQIKAQHVAPAPVQSGVTIQATAQDIQAEGKKEEGGIPKDGISLAADSKGAATADVPLRPGGLEPSLCTPPKNAMCAEVAVPPGHSEHPASSPNDVALLAPTPVNASKGGESMKALNALLDVRGEQGPLLEQYPSGIERTKYTLPYGGKVLVATLVSVVILGFAFFLQAKPKAQREVFCSTKGCLEHRRRIEIQLDRDVDPCDDFGAYVCGRWASRKEFLLSRSQMTDMLLAWLYKLPATLSAGVVDSPASRKAGAMFNKCMTQEGSQVRLMKEFMSARGILWPEKPPVQVPLAMVLFDLSFNWNVHLLFTLKVLSAIPGKVQRRIILTSNHLMLLWKAMVNEIPKEQFKGVYTSLFKIFANDKSSLPDAEEISLTLSTLEYVLDSLVPSCPCTTRIPALLRLGDIDSSISLPIAAHMKDMFNDVQGISPPVTLDDLVLVSDLSEFKTVIKIITQVNDTALLRHLSFLFVQAYGAVAYPAGFLLAIHGSEERAKEEWPRFCAGQIEPSLKLLISAMASVAHFSHEERRRIVERMEDIVEVAANKTSNSSWLDTRIKDTAAEKLRNVRTVVWPSDKFLAPNGLEDLYGKFTDQASSFTELWIETRRSQRLLFGTEAANEEMLLGDNTQLPYVEYFQMLNLLSLSLGALAPPLYYPDGTSAMLHGGVLYMYARALMSAIDNEGIMINSQGETMKSLVKDKILDTFERRTSGCLPGNVSIFPEVPAMEVAYEAFKLHLDDNYTDLSEELTEEKVFFITACLSACATTPADNLYGGDCNKAVMNFAPFAKVFNCSLGSKMNPAKKCSFYE